MPEPLTTGLTPPAPAVPRVQDLEEFVEPLEAAMLLEPFTPGAVVLAGNGSSYRIRGLLSTGPLGCLYDAVAVETGTAVWLRQSIDVIGAAKLRHEADVLNDIDSRMFPRAIGCFESNGSTFLASESLTGQPTFADWLHTPERPLGQALSIVAQAAFAMARLHERGWLHLGLRPAAVALGKPVMVFDLSHAVRIGEKPPAPFYLVGYSPPELLVCQSGDVRSDVYGLGAMLYHAVNGSPLGEIGAELSNWRPATPVAGIPQILHRCLGSIETRYASVHELHRDLLRLAHRLAPVISHGTALASTIGLEPSRTTNQDAFGCLTGRLESEEGPHAWTVACLADGMGGMAAGEVASEAAVRALLAEAGPALAPCRSVALPEQAQMVKRWFQHANDQVCAALESQHALGGCTLVCACIIDRRLTIGHVGDSRIYLVRDGQATLLTRDHSLAMTQVQQGQLALEDIRKSADRNKVLRSLGERRPLPDHFVDTLEQTTGKLGLELRQGDVVILACDGLWEPVTEAELVDAVVRAGADLDAAARALLNRVLQRDAPDNATVMLLRMDETPKEFSEKQTMLDLVFKPHRQSLKSGMAEAQKVYAMLKVIPNAEVARTRPPLAFALVVDTSGSMKDAVSKEVAGATKLDQAISAGHTLIDDDRLLPTDKVSVIQFDDTARVLLPLTPLSRKQAAHEALESLRQFAGGTWMGKGMQLAYEQMCDLPPEVAKRVLLLTDGQTSDEAACRPLAEKLAATNTPIIALGIGEDYQEGLLKDIAEATQGRPYPLPNMAELRAILNTEIGSSVREVFTDLRLTVSLVKGVQLEKITRVYPALAEVGLTDQPFRLGNIKAGDYTVFVLDLAVGGMARPPSRVRLAHVTVAGHAPALRRSAESPPQDLFAAFTTDEAAVAAVDAEVLGYVQQTNVDRMVQEAMRQATVNAGQARKTLQVAVGMTQRLGNPAMTQMLSNALDELNKSGTISAGTRKTVSLGGRTKTIKTGSAKGADGLPSEEQIRKITGA